MSIPILKRLKAMVGKTWLYKGHQITIEDYHVMGDEGFQIDVLGKDPIKVKDAAKFIESCLAVDNTAPAIEPPASTAVSTEVLQETNGLLKTLQETLLHNIAQVQKDANYIKQANTINSSVNALVGLAKLQIQATRMNGGKK